MFLGPEDVREDYFKGAKSFHYGSISMIDELPKKATFKGIQIAKDKGLLISYDPNFRPNLWGDLEHARSQIWEGFKYADVAKVSEEEWKFITGSEDFESGCQKIISQGVKLVVISRGEAGCYFNNGMENGYLDGFKVDVVEVTGAGDGFVAQLIVGLLGEMERGIDLSDLLKADLEKILLRANAVGALTTTKSGAIPGLPTKEEVGRFLMQEQQR